MKPSKKILILIMTSVALLSCSPNPASEQAPQMTSTTVITVKTPTQPAPTQNSTPAINPTSEPLTTPIPNESGLTIEENEIIGAIDFEPLTFEPVYGSQEAILERHAEEKERPSRNLISVVINEEDRLIASESFASPEEGTVTLRRNNEIIFEVDIGEGSTVTNLRGLWVEDGDWVLEVAHVSSTKKDNTVHLEITGQVYRNGVNLNDLYGYEEIFGYQHLDDKPFYFYKLDGKIHLSYDGKDLPLWYDKVWHYGCCSIGALNPITASNWIGFWGIRDDVRYYTEIGRY
jgi:hypothetical protein